jgi:hypothetical protein
MGRVVISEVNSELEKTRGFSPGSLNREAGKGEGENHEQ